MSPVGRARHLLAGPEHLTGSASNKLLALLRALTEEYLMGLPQVEGELEALAVDVPRHAIAGGHVCDRPAHPQAAKVDVDAADGLEAPHPRRRRAGPAEARGHQVQHQIAGLAVDGHLDGGPGVGGHQRGRQQAPKQSGEARKVRARHLGVDQLGERHAAVMMISYLPVTRCTKATVWIAMLLRNGPLPDLPWPNS